MIGNGISSILDFGERYQTVDHQNLDYKFLEMTPGFIDFAHSQLADLTHLMLVLRVWPSVSSAAKLELFEDRDDPLAKSSGTCLGFGVLLQRQADAGNLPL
jgi:hypothetical protein